MNPVIGLDVSKGESQVQAFLDKGKPYRKSFSVKHNTDGLSSLLEFLHEIKSSAGGHQHSVVLESTGHYHFLSFNFLRSEIIFILLSILLSHIEPKVRVYGR